MKFYNIPETKQFEYELIFDGDKEDKRLHWEPMFAWYATDEETYQKIEQMIDESKLDQLQRDLYDAVDYAESIEDEYFNPDEIPAFN